MNETFNYTYSAKEQDEIEKIRKKYEEPKKEEDNLQKLRDMDAKVTKKAQAYSLSVGVVGALILGFGMSLMMTDLSTTLGIFGLLGIPVGIVGIILICLAYPLHKAILKRERKKIVPEILRLSDELTK